MTSMSGYDVKISRIELTPVRVPFPEMVQEAMKPVGGLGMMIPAEDPWLAGDFVICRLIAEDGSIGLGEALVWLPETGATTGQIIDMVQNALHRYVIGESPFNLERIRYRVNSNVTRNEAAKGLLDMACWDLMGKIAGLPCCSIMGGHTVTAVPLAALIPLASAQAMADFCSAFFQEGIRTFRLKIGKSVANDIQILKTVRKQLGDKARIRVDYNQAYSPSEAVRAIKSIEPFGIDVAEQPVSAVDVIGMAYVQSRVDTPLMAHEGCFSLQDIISLVELKAVRVIGINAMRPGGITNALRAIDYAELRGMGVVIHNQCLGIASASQIHLAAARHHALGHDVELFGHVMFEDDLIKRPVNYGKGAAEVPQGPGWGVELDESAMDKYAVGPTVNLS
jgi:muconate cycloisomerase